MAVNMYSKVTTNEVVIDYVLLFSSYVAEKRHFYLIIPTKKRSMSDSSVSQYGCTSCLHLCRSRASACVVAKLCPLNSVVRLIPFLPVPSSSTLNCTLEDGLR